MNISYPNTIARLSIGIVLTAVFTVFLYSATPAQKRDSMTEPEVELVREAQDIDLRIDVLTKMIDRRFAAAKIEAGGSKPPAKESDKWGPEPEGTHLQLLTDIRRLLQKAIDDVDDVAEHDKNTLTQNKTTGKLFPKAVRNLGAAAARYAPALKSSLLSTNDEMERGSLFASIDLCEQIIEAAARIPAEQKKTKN